MANAPKLVVRKLQTLAELEQRPAVQSLSVRARGALLLPALCGRHTRGVLRAQASGLDVSLLTLPLLPATSVRASPPRARVRAWTPHPPPPPAAAQLVEPDEPWDFDALLQTVAQEMQSDADDAAGWWNAEATA